LLVGVFGAVDGFQLDDGRMLGEPVEHASGSDRGELLAVANGNQLCAIDRRTRPGRAGRPRSRQRYRAERRRAGQLANFDFKRGRKREGYRGDYYTLPA
jgi:hypothetical protein